MLKLGSVNYSPQAKSGPLPVLVNIILLAHSYAHLFTHCQWLFSCDDVRVEEQAQRPHSLQKWKYLLSDPLQKNLPTHRVKGWTYNWYGAFISLRTSKTLTRRLWYFTHRSGNLFPKAMRIKKTPNGISSESNIKVKLHRSWKRRYASGQYMQ